MPNGHPDVLDTCFCLVADPFDPKVDPRRDFSFFEKKARLSTTLKIFDFSELEDYFIKIGMFGTAVQTVADFLAPGDYDVQLNNPPSFLIEAPRGAGRSSLANQIAHQIKQHINGDCELKMVPVVGEDLWKLVFAIKKLIETHIKQKQIQDCDSSLDTYGDDLINGPNGPDMTYLSMLLEQLTNCMIGAPPLLLIIEEITDDRKKWISILQRVLAPLNVVLIFLTSEYSVRKYYETLVNGDLKGCWVGLEKMDQQCAVDFLTKRLDSFRKDPCDPTRRDVFPFDPAVFTEAFKDENKGVKRLLFTFQRAFLLKLQELSAHQEPETLTLQELLITWKYFQDGLREGMREVVTKKV